jgi:hypothetical protein
MLYVSLFFELLGDAVAEELTQRSAIVMIDTTDPNLHEDHPNDVSL